MTLDSPTAEENNVLPFAKTATGGDDNTGASWDWLSPIPHMAYFLARPRNPKPVDNTFLLQRYRVIWVGEKARTLQVFLNQYYGRPDDTVCIDVDPVEFCKMNRWFETIKEEENGYGNRSNPNGGLADDGHVSEPD